MITLRLTWPEFFALRSLVAEHLLCPNRSEVYVSVVPERGEVTHEHLLTLLLTKALDDRPVFSEDERLYQAAREACHAHGLPWTDPRTGETFDPPPDPPANHRIKKGYG